MTRSLRFVPVLAAALTLGACASAGPGGPDLHGVTDFVVDAQRAQSDAPAPQTRPGKSTGAARVGEWAWKGPLNVVYWPWKLVGKTGRGLVDGIGAGFEEGRMPLMGLIMSLINAATGTITGLVEGIGLSPQLLTPDVDADKAFAKPTSTPTTIWWY